MDQLIKSLEALKQELDRLSAGVDMYTSFLKQKSKPRLRVVAGSDTMKKALDAVGNMRPSPMHQSCEKDAGEEY